MATAGRPVRIVGTLPASGAPALLALIRKAAMAKAILGHVGGPDPRLLAEVARLRRRVSELEAEVVRLTEENQALLPDSIESALAEEIITLEPAAETSAPVLA